MEVCDEPADHRPMGKSRLSPIQEEHPGLVLQAFLGCRRCCGGAGDVRHCPLDHRPTPRATLQVVPAVALVAGLTQARVGPSSLWELQF